MVPSNGYGLNTTIIYEDNDFLSGFGVDEEYGTFGANLSPNNTFRIKFDAYYNVSFNSISLSSKLKYKAITNTDIDDFFYIFGGGGPGLKGYTYYEDSLSGTNIIIFENYLRSFLFKEKSIQLFHLQVQAASLGLVHQFGADIERLVDRELLGSIGVEFQALGYSFFSYPTAVRYEYFIPYREETSLNSGKHYMSILFDF